MSSAYMVTSIPVYKALRSLEYNKNKIGPNTDPCGTPVLIILRLELVEVTVPEIIFGMLKYWVH